MLRDVCPFLEKWGGFGVCEAQVGYGCTRRTEIRAGTGKATCLERAFGVAFVCRHFWG